MQMLLSEIGSILFKGALVIHADVPDDAKKMQVGRVQKLLPDGDVEVNWGHGASFGDYSPSKLVIYDPY